MNWDRFDTPLKLARALWSVKAIELPASEFRELSDRVYQNTNDLETLWQLGGAINDYLRRFPATVPVPRELPFRLLRSDDQDARIIALKLLNRSGAPEDQILQEIVLAIQRDDDCESVGAFYELNQYLDRRQENDQKIPESFVPQLCRLLERASANVDNHPKWRADYAERTLARLETIRS
jgi:hypothetical protein